MSGDTLILSNRGIGPRIQSMDELAHGTHPPHSINWSLIRTLVLDHNQIGVFSPFQPVQLASLYLDYNILQTLDTTLPMMNALSFLSATHNKLTRSINLGAFKNLVYLKLSNNRIDKLYGFKSSHLCNTLEVLLIPFNCISHFSNMAEVIYLENLHVIDFRHNLLSSYDDAICTILHCCTHMVNINNIDITPSTKNVLIPYMSSNQLESMARQCITNDILQVESFLYKIYQTLEKSPNVANVLLMEWPKLGSKHKPTTAPESEYLPPSLESAETNVRPPGSVLPLFSGTSLPLNYETKVSPDHKTGSFLPIDLVTATNPHATGRLSPMDVLNPLSMRQDTPNAPQYLTSYRDNNTINMGTLGPPQYATSGGQSPSPQRIGSPPKGSKDVTWNSGGGFGASRIVDGGTSLPSSINGLSTPPVWQNTTSYSKFDPTTSFDPNLSYRHPPPQTPMAGDYIAGPNNAPYMAGGNYHPPESSGKGRKSRKNQHTMDSSHGSQAVQHYHDYITEVEQRLAQKQQQQATTGYPQWGDDQYAPNTPNMQSPHQGRRHGRRHSNHGEGGGSGGVGGGGGGGGRSPRSGRRSRSNSPHHPSQHPHPHPHLSHHNYPNSLVASYFDGSSIHPPPNGNHFDYEAPPAAMHPQHAHHHHQQQQQQHQPQDKPPQYRPHPQHPQPPQHPSNVQFQLPHPTETQSTGSHGSAGSSTSASTFATGPSSIANSHSTNSTAPGHHPHNKYHSYSNQPQYASPQKKPDASLQHKHQAMKEWAKGQLAQRLANK